MDILSYIPGYFDRKTAHWLYHWCWKPVTFSPLASPPTSQLSDNPEAVCKQADSFLRTKLQSLLVSWSASHSVACVLTHNGSDHHKTCKYYKLLYATFKLYSQQQVTLQQHKKIFIGTIIWLTSCCPVQRP